MLMSINFTFTENKNTVVSSAEKKGLGYLKHRQGRVLTTQRDLRKGTLDPGRWPKIHMELKQRKGKVHSQTIGPGVELHPLNNR